MHPSALALRLRFIAFLLAYTFIIPSRCQSNLQHRSCSISDNYTASGKFAKNLNRVLHYLATTTPTTGFTTSTAGVGPSRVFGLALCRVDASHEDCRTCVANAISDAVNLCPGSISVKLWYTYCLIRYSNLPFFDTFDEYGFITCNLDKPAIYPDIFSRQLDFMMSNLSAEAADGRMFAIATRNIYATNDTSTPNKIYGLVQCTRDLSPVNCSRCLSHLRYRSLSVCAGYQGGRSASGACMLLYDTYLFFRVPQVLPAAPLPVRLSAKYYDSPPPPPPVDEQYEAIVICLSTILPLIALQITIDFCICCHRRRQKKQRQESQISNSSAAETDPEETARTPEEKEESKLLTSKHTTEAVKLEEIKECNTLPVAGVHLEDREFRFYDMETIRVATDDFLDANKLGEGGYGPVYKGKLGGVDVAVKRLRTGTGRGKEEFMNEVKVAAKLQHRNLVRLLGCCAEKNERILVYEYMSNTSLDKILFDRTKRVLLDWPKRLKIINGVARGLLYLHEDSRLTIIHRDLKASNVLLDMDMTPKISDFGLARNFEGLQTHASTMRFAGTHGYMAPEYLLHGRFSPKYDVFSFGVLILEIVSGPRNQPGKESLLEHVWRLWRDERTLELVDTSLLKSCQVSEVLRCIQIGLLCVQDEAQNRPPMSSVVLMLGSTSTELPSPSPSTLFMGQGRIESQTTASASLTTNGFVNVADLEAR